MQSPEWHQHTTSMPIETAGLQSKTAGVTYQPCHHSIMTIYRTSPADATTEVADRLKCGVIFNFPLQTICNLSSSISRSCSLQQLLSTARE